MSIVGNLLPEQLTFFAEKHDLADIIDSFDEFTGPYKLYLNGEFIRSADVWNEEAFEIGELLEAEDSNRRIVVLDNMGSIVFSNVDKPSTPGQFHLVYSVEVDSKTWNFFDERRELVNADWYDSYGFGSLDLDSFKGAVFDPEDFTDDMNIDLQKELVIKEFVLNLQQIARLYPLLEIKIYRQ